MILFTFFDRRSFISYNLPSCSMSPQKDYGTLRGHRTALGSLMNNDPILVEKSNTEIATKKNLVSLPEAGSAVRNYSQSRQQQRHRSRSRSNPREKKDKNNSDANDAISGTDSEPRRPRPRGKSTEGVEMIDRSQITIHRRCADWLQL